MNPEKRRINPAHLEQVIEITNASPYYRLLDMRLVEVSPGHAVIEMDINPKMHMNPFGSVHGGVNASLIDCATYWAAYCNLEEGMGFTTLDISVNNLSMARSGKLTVEASAIKEGRSICLCEASVRDENGRLVAYGTSKLMILSGRQSIADAVASANHAPVPPKFLK